MNVALYCRNIKPHDIPVLQHVLDLLAENKIGVFIFKPFLRVFGQPLKPVPASVLSKHMLISATK